jgi:hypothetical protein
MAGEAVTLAFLTRKLNREMRACQVSWMDNISERLRRHVTLSSTVASANGMTR